MNVDSDTDRLLPSGHVASQMSASRSSEQREGGLENAELLTALAGKVDQLTEALQDAQDSMLSKKLKPENDFKRKGNEIQFNFNTSILDIVNTAITYNRSNKTEKVDKLLNAVAAELEERNKLILIADRSEFGWETVRHYQKPELADNDADSLRIRQANANARAELKRKLENDDSSWNKFRKYKTFGRGQNFMPNMAYNAGNGFFQSTVGNVPVASFGAASVLPNTLQPFSAGPGVGSWGYAGGQFATPQIRTPVQCYNCMQYGHIQSSCPFKRAGSPQTSTATVPFKQ